MATVSESVPMALAEKLGSVGVNVSEIQTGSSSPEVSGFTSSVRGRSGIARESNGMSLLARTVSPTGSTYSSFSRRVKNRFGFRAGLMRSHRSEVSKELSRQAETEFIGLIELMSAVSRRSSSLKEVWAKIIVERESYFEEIDRMYEQMDEYTETVERHEKERQAHTQEHDERKQDLVKVRLELTAAVASAAEFQKKLDHKDRDLVELRARIKEYQDKLQFIDGQHDGTRTQLEEMRLKFVSSEESRLAAIADGKRHENELKSLRHELSTVNTNYTELSTRYDTTNQELSALTGVVATLRKEQNDWTQEKGDLEQRYRKSEHRHNDIKHQFHEATEHHEKRLHEVTETLDKKKREIAELLDSLTKAKHEKDELHTRVKTLHREREEEHRKWEDADQASNKYRVKWEQAERETAEVREELRVLETQQTDLRETIRKTTLDLRKITDQKALIDDEYRDASQKRDAYHRDLVALQESQHTLTTTIEDKSKSLQGLTDRFGRLEVERDDWRSRHGELDTELTALRESVAALTLEVQVTGTERDGLRDKLQEVQAQFDDVCETVEYNEAGGDSSSYEEEVAHFRAMLKEAREEKERAIAARTAADRERDEAEARYEAKCREMERLEEKWTQELHVVRGKAERRSFSSRRFFSRSSSSAIIENGEREG